MGWTIRVAPDNLSSIERWITALACAALVAAVSCRPSSRDAEPPSSAPVDRPAADPAGVPSSAEPSESEPSEPTPLPPECDGCSMDCGYSEGCCQLYEDACPGPDEAVSTCAGWIPCEAYCCPG